MSHLTFNLSHMSTEPNTSGTEQNATNTAEEVTEEVTSTTGENTAEESPKTLTAEEKKQQIVDSFQKRLDRGEISMEYIQENQPWVAEKLSKKQEEESKVDVAEIARKEAQKLLEVEREKTALNDLDERLKALRPSKAKLEEVESEYQKYEDSLGPVEAKKLAIKLAGLDVSDQALRRRSMAVPMQGNSVSEDNPDDEVIMNQEKHTDEEIMKIAQKRKARRGL